MPFETLERKRRLVAALQLFDPDSGSAHTRGGYDKGVVGHFVYADDLDRLLCRHHSFGVQTAKIRAAAAARAEERRATAEVHEIDARQPQSGGRAH